MGKVIFKEPLGVNLYSIVEEGGRKIVQLLGYTWNAWGTRGPHCPWVYCEYRNYDMPIEEFVDHKDDPDYFFNTGTAKYQAEQDCQAEDIVEILNGYFYGEGPDKFLPYSEVSIDTPCGNYYE